MPAGRQYSLSVLLTAIDRVSGPVQRIRANLARATSPFREVGNRMAALRAETRGLSSDLGLPQLRQAAGGVVNAIQQIGTAGQTSARRLGLLTAAGVGAAFLFKREFIGTASLFENLEASLEAIEGSRERARDAMAFIQELTIKTPFEMADVARSFRVMRGFGLDPRANGTLRAVTDQVAKLGGSGEDLTGIALQLGQAFSKGRLQAQDANILVERGVPVWGLLQRAVERVNKGQKVTIAQLRQMSEDGQLGTQAVIELIRQMGLESAGASTRMMGTWTGLTSNLSDQWTLFKKRVMDTGAFREIKAAVAGILQQIDRMATNGELQAWAERIGAALRDAFAWVRREGPGILAQIREALGTIWSIGDRVARVFGGWGNFITFGIAAYIGGPMVASVFSLVAAIGSLNLALAGTPAGWLLLAGAGLLGAGAFVALKSLRLPGDTAPTGPRPIPGASGARVPMDELLDLVRPGQGDRDALAYGGGVTLGPAVTGGAASPAAFLRVEDIERLRASLDANTRAQSGAAADVKVNVTAPPGSRVTTETRDRSGASVRRGLTMAEAH
jgi:tape measure domain-containing protein